MKICIVGPGSLPLLLPDSQSNKRVGGAELQTFLINKHLAKHCQTCLVTEDAEELTPELAKQLNVHPTALPDAGVRFIRFIHPRWTSLWRSLHQANSDVYYIRAARPEAGIIALFSKLNRRKFVYGMANDDEFEDSRWQKRAYSTIERPLFEFGIKSADQIIVQNNFQQDLIKKKLGRASVQIKNIYNGPILKTKEEKEDSYILNVGNILPKKQHHNLLDLAEQLPQIPFKIIGGGSGEYYQSVVERAQQLPNVELLGFQARKDIFQFYAGARMMVHTAETEGFPNVFLEAWGHRLPVVSLNLDPGGVISTQHLGRVAKNINVLKNDIQELWDSPKLRKDIGQKANIYLQEFHSPERISQIYLSTFQGVI